MAATRPAFSDPSQAASEVIAGVGGGAAVTAARVGVGGHQLGGDGGGGAAHQSKEEYSDAKPELHERPPISQLSSATRCLLITMNDFRTAGCGFSHEARVREREYRIHTSLP